MPDKSSQTERERKHNSKKKEYNKGIYTSKHIRIQEKKLHIEKKDKKSDKNKN